MPRILVAVVLLANVCSAAVASAQADLLGKLEQLATADPKPFVVVEAIGEGSISRGQGVVVSAEGHVLTAGHVAWNGVNSKFSDDFRACFRGSGKDLPKGIIHVHKTVFSDREDAAFLEHFYRAKQRQDGKSRFIGNADLAILKIEAEGTFPTIEFFAKEKPAVALGEVFQLCHYNFPNSPADPHFLISPVEVVGVVETSSGFQYLAKGYYRVGSSGGAILKQGKLIGIQSAGYTINAKDVGEIPLGLISFQLVWEDLFGPSLKSDAEAQSAENPRQ